MKDQKIKKLKKKNFSFPRWLTIFVTSFFISFLGIIALLLVYVYKYQDRIYPGITIAGIHVSGLTQKQAYDVLSNKKEGILRGGLNFFYHENAINVPPALVATDPNLARPIISFDISRSIASAYQHGRKNTFLKNIITQLNTFRSGKDINIHYELNKKELLSILQLNFDDIQKPPLDAKLLVREDNTITVLPEKDGWIFNYDDAISLLKENLTKLKDEPIELTKVPTKPNIYKSETSSALELAQKILATTTPTLTYEEKTWNIGRDNFIEWIEFHKPKTSPGEKKNIDVMLGLNHEKTIDFLKEIAKEIDIEPIEAKFQLTDHRVTEFRASKDGRQLHMEKTYAKINKEFFYEGKNIILLEVESLPSKVTTGDINDMGIKELIGVGRSNFSGSPKNRRHNIKVGSEKLNGVLIAPGEEFSLLKTLGKVDGEHGFLPELVIKGNRTIPEYGGGLCQVSTTLFRAALNAGLPITQRKNHSYRVIYYEPAGIDATIYDPSPDLRFLNDTGNHILMVTRIEDNDLIYEFYGTKDGRVVEIPERAKIFNITSPGPTKYIETDELKPGEKKRVERAINGAETEFEYKVTYTDGTQKKETFYSRYVAWPEVWLVGKEPQAATTTEEMISGE